MDAQVVSELRQFRDETRETLACIKKTASEIEKHQIEQNGNIVLVMERERDTHDCAVQARDLAQENARDIVALRVAANSDRAHDKEREGEMRAEVKWLRDNVWKLALGGVSLLALLDQAVALAQRLGGSP